MQGSVRVSVQDVELGLAIPWPRGRTPTCPRHRCWRTWLGESQTAHPAESAREIATCWLWDQQTFLDTLLCLRERATSGNDYNWTKETTNVLQLFILDLLSNLRTKSEAKIFVPSLCPGQAHLQGHEPFVVPVFFHDQQSDLQGRSPMFQHQTCNHRGPIRMKLTPCTARNGRPTTPNDEKHWSIE